MCIERPHSGRTPANGFPAKEQVVADPVHRSAARPGNGAEGAARARARGPVSILVLACAATAMLVLAGPVAGESGPPPAEEDPIAGIGPVEESPAPVEPPASAPEPPPAATPVVGGGLVDAPTGPTEAVAGQAEPGTPPATGGERLIRGPLPLTGQELLAPLVAGTLLVLVGIVMLAAPRSRHRPEPASR